MGFYSWLFLLGGWIVLFPIILCLIIIRQFNAVRSLGERLDALQRQLNQRTSLPRSEKPSMNQGVSSAQSAKINPVEVPSIHTLNAAPEPLQADLNVKSPVPEKQDVVIEGRQKQQFEMTFGARLPVWIGAIALILSVFFLVQYSISAGLLSPPVRVIMGFLLGIGLLGVGTWIQAKPQFANGVKIAQALTGAGISVLYVAIYAATSLYALIPSLLGFINMIAVTGIAIVLSLRHGAPIALLGLIGGMLTPYLIHTSDPSAVALFSYLYFVLSGFFLVARRHGQALGLLAISVTFFWVIVWLQCYFMPADGLWLELFLVAATGTYIAVCGRAPDLNDQGRVLNGVLVGATAFLIAVVGYNSGFKLLDWGLFGALGAGTIVLAWFDPKTYRWAPWFSMFINALMLVSWGTHEPQMYYTILTLFAVFYCLAGHVCLWRSSIPAAWGGFIASTALVYYLVAYFHPFFMIIDSATSWGVIALGLFALATGYTLQIHLQFQPTSRTKDILLSVFILTASAFLTFGTLLLCSQSLWPVVFAVQIFVSCWLNDHVNLKALRWMVTVYSVLFILVLAPQIMSLGVFFDKVMTPAMHFPLLQLAFPALLLGRSSYLLRQQKDDGLVGLLESTTLALIAVAGYCVIRNLFNSSDSGWSALSETFIERGVITNVFFVLSLFSLFAAKRWHRPILHTGALVIFYVALARIFLLDYILCNPLLSSQNVGSGFLVNGLIVTFGFPCLWVWLFNRLHPLRFAPFVMLTLALTLVTLNVRQIYQGAFLDGAAASNAEIYTYSAIWIILAIGLLLAGTLQKNKTLRIASLVLMILAVSKTFLYDTSALTGLYRALSFFIMGIVLIALSWFYSRFVFKKNEP